MRPNAPVRWPRGRHDRGEARRAADPRRLRRTSRSCANGKPVAFLDSAASTQKPRQVLDALRDFYEHSYANVHRGVYQLAERATAGYEGAREKVRAFVNAPSTREIVFTRSATESINLVAYAWGLDNLGPGDLVVVTELEHHSNFVPWQYIAKRTGAGFRDDPDRRRRRAAARRARRDRARGQRQGRREQPRLELARHREPGRAASAAWAHEHGAIMVVDAAQAAPHRAVDVQALGCDFLAFSSHKMCGPSGVGALWGRAELLDAMAPFNLGGHMIRSVRYEDTTWGQLPYKFEAGTQPIAEAFAFGAAIDYVSAIGLDAIEQHEHELVEYAMERLSEIDGLSVYGPPPERRAGIVSFNLDNVHPHDVSQVLDWENVAIRGGHHCTQPLMKRLGVAATCRASFYVYSIRDEVDRLVDGLAEGEESLRLVTLAPMGEFDQLYREVILDHYKNPRGHGAIAGCRRARRGTEPALRRRGVDLRLVRRRRRHDRRGEVRGPRLRDLAGGDVDAHGDGDRAEARRRSRRCRRRSCSRRSGSRSRRCGSSARSSASACSRSRCIARRERRCRRSGRRSPTSWSSSGAD